MDLSKMNTPDKPVKLDNVKDDGKKILDKYGVITRNEGGKDIVEFGMGTKIQSIHTNPNAANTSSREGVDAVSKQSGKPIEVKDSKVTLDQAKITTVDTTEKDGVITMTVKNKDGSSDTYTVSGAKEARQKVGSADGGTWNVETDSRIPGTRGGY